MQKACIQENLILFNTVVATYTDTQAFAAGSCCRTYNDLFAVSTSDSACAHDLPCNMIASLFLPEREASVGACTLPAQIDAHTHGNCATNASNFAAQNNQK